MSRKRGFSLKAFHLEKRQSCTKLKKKLTMRALFLSQAKLLPPNTIRKNLLVREKRGKAKLRLILRALILQITHQK